MSPRLVGKGGADNAIPHLGAADADWLGSSLSAGRKRFRDESWLVKRYKIRRPTDFECRIAKDNGYTTCAAPGENYVAIYNQYDMGSVDLYLAALFSADASTGIDFEDADPLAIEIVNNRQELRAPYVVINPN